MGAIMRKFLCGIVLAASIPAVSQAATVTVFTDRAAFLAATFDVATENLNSVTEDRAFNDGTPETVGALTFSQINASTGGFIDAAPVTFPGAFGIDETVASFFVGFDSASITLTEEVTAFGGDWASLNTPGSQRFNINGEEIAPAPTAADNGVVQFYGFISDMPFDVVTITGVSGQGDGFTGDNFVFGTAVPLPATLPLMLVGMGLFAALRRPR